MRTFFEKSVLLILVVCLASIFALMLHGSTPDAELGIFTDTNSAVICSACFAVLFMRLQSISVSVDLDKMSHTWNYVILVSSILLAPLAALVYVYSSPGTETIFTCHWQLLGTLSQLSLMALVITDVGIKAYIAERMGKEQLVSAS